MTKIISAILISSLLYIPYSSADQHDDRVAIEDLMWRYVRALDTLDTEAYAAVFTEDGQFGTGENASVGREGLMQLIEGVKSGRAEREANGAPPSPQMHHMIVNHRIEFINDSSARYHSYWMTVFAPAEQEQSPNVAAVGRAIDELVKINGQWLIKVRNVSPE